MRWLSQALAQLDRIHAYLSQRNPRAARQVFLTIRQATKHLAHFPDSGRRGQVFGTREHPFSGMPYLIVYRVTGDSVEIMRVVRTSMNWTAAGKR